VSVTAYVLIQTEVGQAAEVVARVRQLDGVLAADDVMGRYDVIVRAEAASLDDLGRMVVSQLQTIPGITHTLTCPVIELT
jgi:DNA-binding Lrp family transcriptional regulator